MPTKTPRRKIEVRDSGVHGRGVYAAAPIAAGTKIIEYTGERITWDVAVDRHPHDPAQPNHTFYFHLDGGLVIDALYACAPNCEADEVDGRVFIKALRDIAPGEELFYDYGLVLDERHTAKVKKQFACWCGALTCRGTMLAPKKGR